MLKGFVSLTRVSRSTGNIAFLAGIHIKTAYRNLIEFFKNFKYYLNLQFFKADLFLFLYYIFNNPFRISKQFLISRQAPDIYAYGETYLTTLHAMTKECGITSKDHFFELGCGRGRTLFWLAALIKCHVTGIEMIPTFTNIGKKLISLLRIHHIHFIENDILNEEFNEATVIYFYGTSFEDNFILQLIEKFESLQKGTKIITVSFPLSDYSDQLLFKTIKQFKAAFPWGIADIYLQVKE